MIEVDYLLSDRIRNKLLDLSTNSSDWYDLNYNCMGLNNKGTFYQKEVPYSMVQEFIPNLPTLKHTNIYLLLTTPHAIIEKHIDTRTFGKKIALTWALSPDLKDFAPTIFYLNDKESIHYYTKKCFIFDTSIPHAMINNNYTRILFQIRYVTHTRKLIEELTIGRYIGVY